MKRASDAMAQFDRRRFLALAGSALGTAGLASTVAWARSPQSHAFKLGVFDVTVLSDGHLSLPASFLAPGADPKALEAALAAAGQAPGRIDAPTNVTLVRTSSDLVLIDTGSGANFMDTAGKLDDALQAASVDREKVTKVVYTHGHPDHLWGTIDDFDDLRFPNASYIVAAAEWDFWMGPDVLKQLPEDRHSAAAGAKRNFSRIRDKVRMIKPGEDIVTGLRAIDTAGHTQGHISIEIASGTASLVVLGDALTHPVISFAHPQWRPVSDHVPDKAVETRRKLLGRLAADQSRIIGYHLPFPGIGMVEQKGAAFAFRPQV